MQRGASPPTSDVDDLVPRSRATRAAGIASWIVGAAALAAVVLAARHFSEDRAFVEIVERARPEWLLVAVVLQLLTYAAQGQVWRTVARAGGAALSLGAAYRLSVAKLFVDQALPSGGLSGTLLFARSLEQRGISRPLVLACVVVDGASYYGAYVVCLAVAVGVASLSGRLQPLVLALSAGFIVLAAAICAVLIAFAGRKAPRAIRRLRRFTWVERGVTLMESVDGSLVRSRALLMRTASFHIGVVLLDSTTVWFLILSLGTVASPAIVFASFMTSTLLRTIGVLPGGLGTFDATSVITLKVGGIPLAVALSATLAFRVLSFWLPMIPGLFFSRQALHRGGRSP